MTPYLRLLGGARVDREDGGQAVRGRAAHRRRLALLALLAAHPGHRLSRERIIAYLWPDRDSETGRKHLSEALHVLRREFGEAALPSVADDVRLDPALIGSDVMDFREALATGDDRRAVSVYAGPFLDGWYVEQAREFDDWAEQERGALAAAYGAALHRLAERAETERAWADAVVHWTSAARLTPTSAMPVVRLSAALRAQGDRAGALRVLDAFDAALAADDLPPDDAIAAQRAAVRTSTSTVAPITHTPDVRPTPPLASDEVAVHVDAAPTMSAAGALSPTQDGLPPLPSPPTPRVPRRWGRVVVAACLLLAVMGGWREWTRTRAAKGSVDPSRIAVLPFQHDGDSTTDFLADAITGKLIDELSTVPALRVVSRTGVLFYRGRERALSLDSIARALRAGLLVEGAVQRRGDRVRVSVALVDATTGMRQGKPVVVERPMTAGYRFALDDDLATALSIALRQRLGETVRLLASRDGSVDELAQEFADRAEYARNSAWLLMQQGSASDMRAAELALVRADSLLAQAEKRDPRWVTPMISRGWVARDRFRLARPESASVFLLQAITHANHALARDSMNTRALELRGTARWYLYAGTKRSAGVDSARQDLYAATDADSTRVIGAVVLSQLVRVTANGDADRREGIRLARRAYDYDVFLAGAEGAISQLFRATYALGQLDSAAAWCRRGRELLPQDFHFLDCSLALAAADVRGASPDTVDRIVRELTVLDPASRARKAGRPYSPVYRQLVAAAVHAAAGDGEAARAVLSNAIRDTGADSAQRLEIRHEEALIHFALAEREAGVAALRLYLAGRPLFTGAVLADPAWRQFGLDSVKLSRVLKTTARP